MRQKRERPAFHRRAPEAASPEPGRQTSDTRRREASLAGGARAVRIAGCPHGEGRGEAGGAEWASDEDLGQAELVRA